MLKWAEELDLLPEHTEWIFRKQLKEHKRLSEELKEVDERIERATRNDPIVAQLKSKRGIGVYTAAVMRAEIGVFSRFQTGKQLSRFCGVTPRNCSSGERQADAGLIKAGNPSLKTAIIEVCHSLVRHDSYWSKFASSLKKRGKPYGVIIGAVANRWMRALHHEMVQLEQVPVVSKEAA
jgi:transposase